MNARPIRIATRASGLARWQAGHVAELMRAASPDCDVEFVHVSTSGDEHPAAPLHTIGTLGVFTREVQKALIDGRADLAVHSLKDLPTATVDGLVLAAVPTRASAADALILPDPDAGAGQSAGEQPLDLLTQHARVGTGSLRRRAQLLHRRPDLQFLNVRGNVETRIRKLDDGQYDALVLAAAGLRRLNRDGRINALLTPPTMYPAVGQGALGIECRSDDAKIRALLDRISDPQTFRIVTAERALLSQLQAGCHAPLGVSTSVAGERLTLEAVVLSRDGRERIFASAGGPAEDAISVAAAAAGELLRQGAGRLVEEARHRG